MAAATKSKSKTAKPKLTAKQLAAESERKIQEIVERKRAETKSDSSDLAVRHAKAAQEKTPKPTTAKPKSKSKTARGDERLVGLAADVVRISGAGGAEPIKSKVRPSHVATVERVVKRDGPVETSGLRIGQLRQLATGELSRGDFDGDELDGFRKIIAKAGRPNVIWGRKLAAMLVALHEDAKRRSKS